MFDANRTTPNTHKHTRISVLSPVILLSVHGRACIITVMNDIFVMLITPTLLHGRNFVRFCETELDRVHYEKEKKTNKINTVNSG